MARIEAMSLSQFMNRDYDRKVLDDIISHLKRNKIAYRVVGLAIIISATGILDSSVLASGTGIDVGGAKIYSKLVSIGKWIIIFKGGWDTIMNTVKGDFETAKKSFLQYLLIYVVLLALPWSLDQVDSVFKGL